MDERAAVRFYYKIRREGADAIRGLADLAEERNDTITSEGVTRTRAELLRALADDVESRDFVIAVVGEFSRGKSTLINVIMGRQGLLPTSIAPSTAAITLLHYSEDEYAKVTYSDGTILDRVPLADLPKYVVGTDLDGKKASRDSARHVLPMESQQELEAVSLPDIGKGMAQRVQGPASRAVKYVDVYVGVPFLRDGVTLVDTPGIGSVNPEHGQATREYIHSADAVIFLINTDPVISDSECSFLMFLQDYIEQFVFAITKIDRFTAEEQKRSIDYTRRTIRDVVGIANPRLYPVSARLAQEGRNEGNEEKVQSSGFPHFQQELEHHLIRERGRYVLQSAARDVRMHLGDIGSAIESELEELSLNAEGFRERLESVRKGLRDSQQAREAICSDIRKALGKAEDLLLRGFDWAKAQDTLKAAVNQEISSYGWAELRNANERIPAFVKKRVDEVVASLLPRMSSLVRRASNDARECATAILAQLGQKVGTEVGSAPALPDPVVTFKTDTDAFRRTIKRVATMTVGSTLALAVAGVFLFGGVGAIAMLGGLLLGGGAAPAMLDKAKDQLTSEVLAALDKMMNQLFADLRSEVVKELDRLKEGVTGLIDSATSNATSALQRMEREEKEIGSDTSKRKAELEAQLERVKGIESAASGLGFYAGYVAGAWLDRLKGGKGSRSKPPSTS